MKQFMTWLAGMAFWCQCIGLLCAQQKSKLGLSPADQQKYDEHIAKAEQSMMMAYLAIGIAVVLVIAMIIQMFRSRDNNKPKE